MDYTIVARPILKNCGLYYFYRSILVRFVLLAFQAWLQFVVEALWDFLLATV